MRIRSIFYSQDKSLALGSIVSTFSGRDPGRYVLTKEFEMCAQLQLVQDGDRQELSLPTARSIRTSKNSVTVITRIFSSTSTPGCE